jgi:hypothetical protein
MLVRKYPPLECSTSPALRSSLSRVFSKLGLVAAAT